MPELPSDEALVARARRGDREAFAVLVRRHQDRVYRLSLRFCGHPEDAADLAQEAFLHAYASLAAFRGESSFSTWLYRITLNLSRDRHRASQRRLRVLEPDGAVPAASEAEAPDNPESVLVGQDSARRLEAAIAALPAIYREAFVMRFVEQLSYEEMRAVLGLPMPALKMRAHRARKMVEAALGGPPPPTQRRTGRKR